MIYPKIGGKERKKERKDKHQTYKNKHTCVEVTYVHKHVYINFVKLQNEIHKDKHFFWQGGESIHKK